MEKNLLRNIYKLLILMRNDIKDCNNNLICTLILCFLGNKGKNKDMLCKLNKIINLDDFLLFFDFASSESVVIKKRELNILVVCIEKIQDCLQMEKYDLAYDLVDAIHTFPEILADNKNIDLHHYWNVYFRNISKVYREDMKFIKKVFGVW